MKRAIYLVVIFLASALSAEGSIETVFEEWLKYHFSGGGIGAPSKVFDKTIKLVSEGKGIEAREYLKMAFPFDDNYINETVQLFEDADNAIPNRTFVAKRIQLGCFSFTDYVFDQNHQDENRPPHTSNEIRSHIAEGVLEAFALGESIVARSPVSAAISAIASVQNFTEAAHKYCENIRWEQDHQSMYDRSNDSEVK